MTSVTHETPAVGREATGWLSRLGPPELWPSLAISVMWLAVVLTALFGPDIVSTTATTSTRTPCAVVVAIFAFFGTWVVARNGFRRRS